MENKKIRVSAFMPSHLADIGQRVMGSKSKFVYEACKHFVNSGGLAEWAAKETEEKKSGD